MLPSSLLLLQEWRRILELLSLAAVESNLPRGWAAMKIRLISLVVCPPRVLLLSPLWVLLLSPPWVLPHSSPWVLLLSPLQVLLLSLPRSCSSILSKSCSSGSAPQSSPGPAPQSSPGPAPSFFLDSHFPRSFRLPYLGHTLKNLAFVQISLFAIIRAPPPSSFIFFRFKK